MTSDYAERKAARAASRRAHEETLKHRQMRKFDREVRDLVLLLVNVHGIPYRMQRDGQHIWLYDGRDRAHPRKISASSLPKTTLGSLREWIEEHYPHIVA